MNQCLKSASYLRTLLVTEAFFPVPFDKNSDKHASIFLTNLPLCESQCAHYVPSFNCFLSLSQ